MVYSIDNGEERTCTTSPTFNRRGASPLEQMKPSPIVTVRIWPRSCVCQKVRAPCICQICQVQDVVVGKGLAIAYAGEHDVVAHACNVNVSMETLKNSKGKEHEFNAKPTIRSSEDGIHMHRPGKRLGRLPRGCLGFVGAADELHFGRWRYGDDLGGSQLMR